MRTQSNDSCECSGYNSPNGKYSTPILKRPMATKKVRRRECFVGLSSTVINLWSLVTGSGSLISLYLGMAGAGGDAGGDGLDLHTEHGWHCQPVSPPPVTSTQPHTIPSSENC